MQNFEWKFHIHQHANLEQTLRYKFEYANNNKANCYNVKNIYQILKINEMKLIKYHDWRRREIQLILYKISKYNINVAFFVMSIAIIQNLYNSYLIERIFFDRFHCNFQVNVTFISKLSFKIYKIFVLIEKSRLSLSQ